MAPPKLGIIAGGGTLPLELIDACVQTERPYFVLALADAADMDALLAHPHARVGLGAVGEALAYLKSAGVEEVVLAGSVKRPSIGKLKMDATGAKLAARLGLKLFAGDDALLSEIVRFMETEGFRVVGAEAVRGSLMAGGGVLGAHAPDARAREDIVVGLKAAHALGALDIGQAVVVENGTVLAVEAAEGTDALLIRSAPLLKEKRMAVLVKARKPGQEARADLPTIGPQTVERAAAAGFAGIAWEAGAALLVAREECVGLADARGLFLFGAS